MDCTRRANGLALTAKLALGIIDVGHIVFENNSIVRTGLGADAATDAGIRTGLLHGRATVLVHAAHEHPHATGSFRTQFDDGFRAGLRAGTASRTFFLVHHRQTGNGIHRQGAELAGLYAVPATQAAERAAGITRVQGRFHTAGLHTLIFIDPGTGLTGSVAADHRYHGGLLLNLVSEDGSHLGHDIVSANGTIIVVQVRGFDSRLGEGTATRETAAAAIRTWHHLLHLIDARILHHLELQGYKIEDNRQHQSQKGDDHKGPKNCS